MLNNWICKKKGRELNVAIKNKKGVDHFYHDYGRWLRDMGIIIIYSELMPSIDGGCYLIRFYFRSTENFYLMARNKLLDMKSKFENE